MNIYPNEDKHPYLIWSIGLVIFSIFTFFFDMNYVRACQTVGITLNLAGVYWIAAGVVVKTDDAANANVTKLFDVQSRRAKYGVFSILVGSIFQILSLYLPG